MNHKQEIFAEELKRTLYWASRSDVPWCCMNGMIEQDAKPDEVIQCIRLFVEKELYIPLVLYLSNEFINRYSDALIRRILVDVLLAQWNESTWNRAVQTMIETVDEFSKEKCGRKDWG